ncbi:DNA glycosylase [Biscogniauxia marginata]|nr:DNA glycosylase [Biscogniauxia marginata]
MPKRGRKTPAVPVRGGWDVLPHNMGVVASAERSLTENSEAAPNEVSNGQTQEARRQLEEPTNPSNEDPPDVSATLTGVVDQPTARRQLRPRKTKITSIVQSLDEIVGGNPTSHPALDTDQDRSGQQGQLKAKREKSTDTSVEATVADLPDTKKQTKRKRSTKKAGLTKDNGEAHADADAEGSSEPKRPKRKARKTKDNPYGLTPGETPFPEWKAPSKDQCEEVYRLLANMHDDVQALAPEVIPAPSLEITGCGEVPSVLDALIRTVLSGATTFANAAKMLQGLTKKYGILEEGLGKGSIDWNQVRISPMEDVVDAIRAGGLAKIKAKTIKSILDMVHTENIERREAYIKEKETGIEANIYGASEKTKGQKDLEILKAEQDVLSLDHIRGLSVNEAMKQFTKYPGVGVKTAACVILFCLQQPCFAVDTHVDKFSKWLGWAPQKATENDVFSHLEVRCPDHLKYGLHQLFIRHGQTCGKCKRSTAEGTEEWKAIDCPLEHLLDRFDKRQSKAQPKPPKRLKKVKEEGAEEDLETEEVNTEMALPTGNSLQIGQDETDETDRSGVLDQGDSHSTNAQDRTPICDDLPTTF